MRKRLVYRADDVGYTEIFDTGIYKAIEEGIVTSADCMFDSRHIKESLTYLKERPWISVGWHRHLWERPVLPPEEVPSMVDEEGRFKWRHNKRKLMDEVTYDDAYREFCAEAELCKKYLGRYPDSASCEGNNELERAFKDVVEKYGIPHNFWGEKHPFATDFVPALPQYQELNFRQWPLEHKDGESKFGYYDLANFKNYDPLGHIMSVKWADDTEIWRVGGHPGYCDEYILSESTSNLHRVKELQACISPELRQWIIDNKIELVNQRDVVNGTNEFQDHLKAINSPLWIGNMK